MSLLVLGLPGTTDEQARALLRALLQRDSISEAVVLATGERSEVYLSTPGPAVVDRAAEAALAARVAIAPAEPARPRYALRGDRAAAQLFRVAVGLDPLGGEGQVAARLRAAWEMADREGAAGPLLGRLFWQALEVGRRVRAAAPAAARPASVSAVAVDLAAHVLNDLPGRRVLLIGAGRVAETTARALVGHGVREVVVAHRAPATARALAGRVEGRGVGLDRLARELAGADIVIASTDAPHPILRPAQVAPAMSARAGRPMVIVDVSVPHDVEVAVGQIAGVALFDIDDLVRLVEANLNGRRSEAERREGYVAEAVRGFGAWRRGLEAGPAIASLRAWAEGIRRAELERVDAKWEELTEADRGRLEALTKAIVNRLLQEPTARVRAAVDGGDPLRRLESLRHLFGLEAGVSS